MPAMIFTRNTSKRVLNLVSLKITSFKERVMVLPEITFEELPESSIQTHIGSFTWMPTSGFLRGIFTLLGSLKTI